jgi:protein phosphatase 1L
LCLFRGFARVQLKEKRRIEEAGGWVIFNGVWRVQGVLAVSRALGDTPFKGRKLVISDPDVLCFPLNGSLDPQFYLLGENFLLESRNIVLSWELGFKYF